MSAITCLPILANAIVGCTISGFAVGSAPKGITMPIKPDRASASAALKRYTSTEPACALWEQFEPEIRRVSFALAGLCLIIRLKVAYLFVA